MRVRVLGSAAGGGFPQWNCRCPICRLAWSGDQRVSARTETSIAVSAAGAEWVILDAAPELRQQIIATPDLHPRGGARDSPVAGVVLTSGDVDHLAGLLCLREGHRFDLFGTAETLAHVGVDTVFGVLDPDRVTRRAFALDRPFMAAAGLRVTAFAVPGKVPLYKETEGMEIGHEGEAVIGLEITDGRATLAYVPGCARVTPALRDRLTGVDVLFFDGTTFTDDEMPRLGLSAKTAARMGHIAMSGPDGSLAGLAEIDCGRRIFIHLNNTNPVLVADSPERGVVTAAGWDVAHDGMEIVL